MEQPIVRLNFTCNRNWEDMQPVENGRFCNDCQKKVVDFSGKSNDEIADHLMNSTAQVCGRFQNTQLAPHNNKTFVETLAFCCGYVCCCFYGNKRSNGAGKT